MNPTEAMKSSIRYAALRRTALLFLSAVTLLGGCREKDDPARDESKYSADELTRYYVNLFTHDLVATYYLWVDEQEVADKVAAWELFADPIRTVADLRYRDAAGNLVDRWTQVTDDYTSFLGSVTGNTMSYGYDVALYYRDGQRQDVDAVVTFTYDEGPARQAGLKRGDTIVKVNGKSMNTDNYADIVNNELFGGSSCSLTLEDGSVKTLTAVKMYENPVNVVKTLDDGAQKIGYLHFTGFTADACEDLIEACTRFKQDGIRTLVLDLRYNGGGYVITEEVLASMLAPVAEVTAGSIFEKEIYNKTLTEAFKEESVSYFRTEFDFKIDGKSHQLSTRDANIGIDKLYVIQTRSSASASESLVCGLKPYLDITLVGGQTHGKYCAGIIESAADWYDAVREQLRKDEYTQGKKWSDNWGCYVMYSRYADKNGVTLSMPDGLAPDVEEEDDPFDGQELGSPGETMLARVLSLAGFHTAETTASRPDRPHREALPDMPRREGFGILVNQPR